jgi:hypothetical protein
MAISKGWWRDLSQGDLVVYNGQVLAVEKVDKRGFVWIKDKNFGILPNTLKPFDETAMKELDKRHELEEKIDFISTHIKEMSEDIIESIYKEMKEVQHGNKN